MAANRGVVYTALALALIGAVAIAALLFKPTASPAASPTSAAVLPAPSPGSSPTAAIDEPTPSQGPIVTEPPPPTATPPPLSAVEMPFVPVVSFWSRDTSISLEDLISAVSNGAIGGYPSVMLPADDAEAIADALQVDQPNVVTGSVADVEAAVKNGALGLMRATDVSQRVRALFLDGRSLFGTERVTNIDQWPLRANVQASAEWDPEALWTLVAAGDVMMDRGVALAVKEHGEGGEYLFDGGTARVTGIRCCSFFGYEYPTTERTGQRGLVREFLQSADVAIANLESAVLVDAPYHPQGLTFTTDASLLDSVDASGFDFMSLANNHIRNAGERGILTAASELDSRGIAHSGVGLGSDAGEPGYVDVNGTRLAIISCDAIRPGWEANADRVGTFNCKNSDVSGRVSEVRTNADVVIVFPHWGREYRAEPADYQRELAAEWIAAGADMVVGAHSHIAGGMEDIDGHVVFYSLGNLIFDQDFRQSTMMGVLPEMTFNGGRLVQIQLHSTLIIDSQPNLVAAADGGQFVFDQMREGSAGLLDY